jgi:phosphoribosylanthranilate isomerase
MTKVKICGITNLDDAVVAAEAGADFLGFLFYARSPRYIAAEVVREIAQGLRARAQSDAAFSLPRLVGVFVNSPTADVRHFLDFCGLDFAQLHGDEPVDDLLSLSESGYKAIRPSSAARGLDDALLYSPLPRHRGPHLLLDAWDPAAFGGTGHRSDWDLAAKIVKQVPNLLLAGGLTPANVGQAIRHVRPWGVDVSSGVEASPGHKDTGRVREFIRQVKAT